MAGKSWDELSPAYRHRLTRAGIDRATFAEAKRSGQLTRARGHGATPERPERARRSEASRQRYAGYLTARQDLTAQVIARKERLFGDIHSFNRKRAVDATIINPSTKRAPSLQAMRNFLANSASYYDWRDWWDDVKDDDDYGFIFYH